MVLKRLIVMALVLPALGCLPRVGVRKLESSALAAVAYVLDPESAGAVRAVPESLKSRVAESLGARNLEPREVPFTALSSEFEATRDSNWRYRKLAAAAGEAPYLLLVETKASFFSQLNGRYRWTVYARVTAGRVGAEPVSAEVTLPAMLNFDHEREAEAVAVASPVIAERAGALFDSFLAAASLDPAPKPLAAPSPP